MMTRQLQGDGGRLAARAAPSWGTGPGPACCAVAAHRLAPAFSIAKSKVDGRAAKSDRRETSGVQERLGVSLPWLRVDRRGASSSTWVMATDSAKIVSMRMGQPACARGVLAVLGATRRRAEVSALIREVQERGVGDVRGGCRARRGGRECGRGARASRSSRRPPTSVSLARRALVCCAKGDDRSWGDATVGVFVGIDAAGAGRARVVRALLCAFVSSND